MLFIALYLLGCGCSFTALKAADTTQSLTTGQQVLMVLGWFMVYPTAIMLLLIEITDADRG